MSSDQLAVFKDAIRTNLGPVQAFLDDNVVSEILINGPHQIFVERKGKLEKTTARFRDEDALRAALNSIAQSVNRRINEDTPRLDARLPDGSRIAAVIPPCSRIGTVISIRKFTNSTITLGEYIKMGSLSEDGARFLDVAMFLGKNIIVSGGTGSGKTTLLGLLCTRIPKGQRVLVIEDSSELQIDYEHVVMFETQMGTEAGKGEVTMKDLVKSALRLRPDRIILGEVRSAEAYELLNAMNTGHKGCMGTVHANSPEDAIVRLEALAQGGDAKVSERALRQQVISAIDLFIQVSRFPDGTRRVSKISEVLGFDASNGGSYNVAPIFAMSRLVRRPNGTYDGKLEATGQVPTFMQEIVDNNLPFPVSKFSVPKAV